MWGRGCGQVVSVFAFYSDDPSSNPTDAYSFFSVKFVFEKNENKPEKRPGLNHLKKHWQCDTISGLGTASLACFFCNLKTSFNVCGCGTIAGWPVICNLVNEYFASNSYSQLYRE